MRKHPLLSCDTMVAVGAATADGTTLFGKNSDRDPLECQRIVRVPAESHAAGSRVACQYLSIPQARETACVLGSQPVWLWGFEHGVNEHGVAIGNEMVITREPAASTGLLGMDLVRLGLERATNAADAVAVMIELIETHGQGGSGQPRDDWPYHNGFIVSDADRAWVLETSGRHWATRSVEGVANISNHLSIGRDWDRVASGTGRFAVERGWSQDAERLDFAGAYRDLEAFPPSLSQDRYERAAALLRERRGQVTGDSLRAVLRNHYDGRPFPPNVPGKEFSSLCMHAGPIQGTTASMVAELHRDASPVAWMALGSPCSSVYLPYYVQAEIPEAVGVGTDAPSADAPWWAFRRLQERVEGDPEGEGPRVRTFWGALEAEISEKARQVEARAADLCARGDRESSRRLLSDFMAANVRAMLSGLEELGAARAA